MATLAAPKAVSPFIRFARYAALGTGIIYGATKLRRLEKKEVVIQEHENKLRAEFAKQAAIARELATKAEMESLAREAGIVPKAT